MASSSVTPATPASAPYVATMVEWICPEQARPVYLGHRYPEPSCHVAFSMRVDEHTSAAFFKLRVPIALKGQARKTNIFLYIHPERISTLQHHTLEEAPGAVRTAFPLLPNNAILQLRFALSKPATAVIPADVPLVPRSTATVNLLRLLRSLALTTQFTVYIADKGQTMLSISSLCDMACGGKLRADPTELRLETMYGGAGAKELSGSELVFPFDVDAPPESPPSYDELVGPPTVSQAKQHRDTESVEPPRKRSRIRSPLPSPAVKIQWKQELQDIRVHLKEEMRQQMQEELRKSDELWQERMKSMREQIKEEMAQQLRSELQRLQNQHSNKLQELERLLEKRIEELREDLHEQIEEVADETSDIVDVRIDEHIMNIKDEMRDYVTEEIKDAEDRIRDDLENGGVVIRFTGPR